MYPVSQAYFETVNSNARRYYWTGTITTTNGVVYNFENKDIIKGSGYITRSCCDSSTIEIGTVYASEMGITLLSDIDRYSLEDAEIKLYFHLILPDESIETVPMGIFEVSEAVRQTRCLELKAYDYMLRFEKSLNLQASSGTPYSFLYAACSDCGVELAQTMEEIELLPNGKETLSIYSENDIETYRDLLFYVAQILGCFCQINREGKLELLCFKNTPIVNIPSTQRFSSSYSDFVTRYTAVSSSNLMTEETEYYALDPDDGLTMNLGANPLLQYGLKTTRARMLNNILNAIAVVEYVPFDSTTIGNPALDPGDVLTFSGGHADDTKISCITSITYKINGKHTLKCVGKNPKLAAAKSKNDKNITGLLNQVESNKTVVYSFMNVSPFSIGSFATEVLSITFTAKESTSAMFLGELLLDVVANDVEKTIEGTASYEEEEITTAEDGTETTTTVSRERAVSFAFTEKEQPVLTVTYKVNGDTVETFIPQLTCLHGKFILTLFYPLSSIIENTENTFDVYLSMSGGTVNIGESQIRATISGQGLVAGIGDWNGRISISEVIGRIAIAETTFGYDAFTDSVTAVFPENATPSIVQTLARIPITDITFGYDLLNERVSLTEIISYFTLDTESEVVYDPIVVEITEDDKFCLVTEYSFVSSGAEINYGSLQSLAIDTTQYESVENMEVELC